MDELTNSQRTVLVIDDDDDLSMLMGAWLGHSGFTVACAADGESGLARFAEQRPAVVVLDLQLPGVGGLEVLRRLKHADHECAVVMVTANGGVNTVVASMQAGAFDYLVKPVTAARLIATVKNAASQSKPAPAAESAAATPFAGIVGDSPPMRAVFEEIERVASSTISTFIAGESGTGKELIARAIHDRSARTDRPFVAINCAAIPSTLQESELFGHEKGAFTGANSRRIGRFEQADGGTLFLDEIGELDLALQAKLLRAIQEKRFFRVGGDAEISSDFRLLSATHRNLRRLVAEGRFREDLFFRLAVFELDVPPLRARGADVSRLVQHFLVRAADANRRPAPRVSAEAMRYLLAYAWPGNVRELQNTMERGELLANGQVLKPEHLPRRVRGESEWAATGPLPVVVLTEDEPGSSSMSGPAMVSPARPSPPTTMTLEQTERAAIEAALAEANGNVSAAVRALGIGRTTLYRKMKRYALKPGRD